ncbi:hypothetical protein AAG906_018640 [Vitis piasezkii]
MMVGINDIEEFKRVFLIFACATLLAPTSHLKVVTRYGIHPRAITWEHKLGEYVLEFLFKLYMNIGGRKVHVCGSYHSSHSVWNDFLVKQRIKLELEMLGGFGKVEVICARMETTQRQITDAQSHLNSLIASYNYDVKVLRTRFTSSHYRTNEGQPSNCHEHVNESGVSERPNVEEGVFFANEDPLHPGPHNMLVLTKEETHVADYVFDESKDPSEMLCAYGGYGVTREQLQCLEFTDKLIEEDEFDTMSERQKANRQLEKPEKGLAEMS